MEHTCQGKLYYYQGFLESTVIVIVIVIDSRNPW